jgi:hypothetical protein
MFSLISKSFKILKWKLQTLNRDLYNILKISDCSLKDYEFLTIKVLEKLKHEFSIGACKLLKERLRIFVLALNTKWQKSERKEHNFLKVNEAWLNLEFIFPDAILDKISEPMDITDSQLFISKERK